LVGVGDRADNCTCPVIRPDKSVNLLIRSNDLNADYTFQISMFYVYLLKLNNGNIYKGSTSNLKRRIAEHKSNKVASTKNKHPMLIGYEAYKLESDARRRERFLKTTEGKRLLKQQYKDILSK